MAKHTRRSFLATLLAALAALLGFKSQARSAPPVRNRAAALRPPLDGRISYYVYDARNHLTMMRDAQGPVTVCHYDRQGNFLSSSSVYPKSRRQPPQA